MAVMNEQHYILKVYKEAGGHCLDTVKKIKRYLNQKNIKIGHFGTLDPFAEGLLLVGVGQALRLNNFIHDELPKKYQAYGILGKASPTGDMTSAEIKSDESDYLKQVISQFEVSFIQDFLAKKFIGDYMQSPHQYSAAKFQGKKLHQWAREGVEIKKEQVKRQVMDLKVINYQFPELVVNYLVSSGTYIRTLFEDGARELGTYGVLNKLVRTEIGKIDLNDCLRVEQLETELDLSPFKVSYFDLLPFDRVMINDFQQKLILSGQKLDPVKHKIEFKTQYAWLINDQEQIVSLVTIQDKLVKAVINFQV
jgi:tRNA pseudouridine55 synthase